MVSGISIRKYQGESTDVTTKSWVEGMQVYDSEADTKTASTTEEIYWRKHLQMIKGRKQVSGEP